MPDSMTPELCRQHQRECAEAVREEICELRRQATSDITAIRAAVQEIDRGVAQIKGFLRMNGSGSLSINSPHAHHRDDEPPKEHQRETDTIGGWVLRNLPWLIITGLILAAVAGERLVERIAK